MKTKIISLLFCALLISSATSGCTAKNSSAPETETPVSNTRESAYSPDDSAEAPENTKNDVKTKKLTSDDVVSMLDEIENYGPGVMGSSLKVCHAAFAFIDLSQEFDPADTEIFETAVNDYLLKYTPEQLEIFKGKISDMEEIAQILFTDGLEALLPRLDAAGNPQKYSEYDEEKYSTLMQIFKNILEGTDAA